MTLTLTFIGTSDSKGVPRLSCDCDICREARQPGSRDRRSRAAIWLDYAGRSVLIDTPPELRLRLTDEGFLRPDGLLMTHAHDDHILGLADVVAAFARSRVALPIGAAPDVFGALKGRFGYLWDLPHWRKYLDEHHLVEPTEFCGLHVEAVRVPHGFNGIAYGFRIAAGGAKLGYFPDAIGIEDLTPLTGLDLLILGANFENEQKTERGRRSVYDVVEALEVGRTVQPGHLILTHLGHTIRYADLSTRLPAWASLAYDGRRVVVGKDAIG